MATSMKTDLNLSTHCSFRYEHRGDDAKGDLIVPSASTENRQKFMLRCAGSEKAPSASMDLYHLK